MFFGSGEESSDICKSLRALKTAESPGDFGFNFEYSDILLGSIVGEGDIDVRGKEKTEDIFFEFNKS